MVGLLDVERSELKQRKHRTKRQARGPNSLCETSSGLVLLSYLTLTDVVTVIPFVLFCAAAPLAGYPVSQH